MKKYYSVILILSYLISCDPPNRNYGYDSVKLKATISDTNIVIHLGDTLKVTLLLPDTIVSGTQKIPVSSVQQGFFGFTFNQLDTTTIPAKVTLMDFYPTLGFNDHNVSAVLSYGSKPFGVILNLVPTVKGIYYFDVSTQAGVLKLNGNYDSNLYVGFDVQDNHYSMLDKYIPGILVATTMFPDLGRYAFRVN
jgi:hypothetical protein